MFTTAELHGSSRYPQPSLVSCRIVDVKHDAERGLILSIDMAQPYDVAATGGQQRFDVSAAQVVELWLN